MQKLQEYMFKIAGFDGFIAKFCTTQHNTISSIGIFFIFQYLAVFESVYFLFFDFVYSNIYISIFVSFFISFLFAKMIKYLLSDFHSKFKISSLFFCLFVNILILLVITSLFVLKIFEMEVLYDLILKGDYYGNNKFTKHIFSLFHQIAVSEHGLIIILFWVAIFLLLQFIFINPYVQIYSIRKTLYNTIKKSYEQSF